MFPEHSCSKLCCIFACIVLLVPQPSACFQCYYEGARKRPKGKKEISLKFRVSGGRLVAGKFSLYLSPLTTTAYQNFAGLELNFALEWKNRYRDKNINHFIVLKPFVESMFC